ncbi:MAG: MIP/aquaporin family protein [Syntrophobacteraceae bacterium]|jgi:glycerol uptake facilitator protein
MEQKWSSKYVMEFIGTYLIVFFGCGAVFEAVYVSAYKDLTPVMLMWAAAVAIPVYIGAAVSGAHFNPSVTIALAIWRGFPWSKVPAYLVSQVAGAFCGAATLWYALFKGFATFFEAEHHLVRGEFGSQLSSMVFTCYIPNPAAVGFTAEAYAKVPLYAGFLSEFIGTAILLLMIFALLEERNSLKPAMTFFPYALGIVIFAVIGLTAPLSMTSLNGARDLGPRILAYLLGWGKIAFPGPRGEFWILTVAPICGAVFAGFLYDKICVKIFPGVAPAEVKKEKRAVSA